MLDKILPSLLFLLLVAGCANNVRAPASLNVPQGSSLAEAASRGGAYLLKAVQEDRGWLSEWQVTPVAIGRTIRSGSNQPVPVGEQLASAIRQHEKAFPRLRFLNSGARPGRQKYYLLHSSLAASGQGAGETIMLNMWAEVLPQHRIVARYNAPVQAEKGVGATVSFAVESARTWQAVLQSASQQLLAVVDRDRGWAAQLGSTSVMLSPLFDAFSGDTLDMSAALLAQLRVQAQQFPHVKVETLTSAGLSRAHYVVHTALAIDKKSNGKLYQLNFWLRENPSGRLLAQGTGEVLSQGLDYKVSAESSDSPVYAEMPAAAERFNLDGLIKRQGNYSHSIGVEAMLADAANAYRQRQYARALEVYQQVAAMPGGSDNLRTQAGRYLSLLRLGRKDDAKKAFAELLRAGFTKSDQLTFKILFAVDSVEFAGDSLLKSQYQDWVGAIASHIDNGGQCLTITGHSSHSGSDAYNLKLSAARAGRIQQLMSVARPAVKPLLRIEGKGFHENIIGTGSDDARDAVDRRVEFRRMACP